MGFVKINSQSAQEEEARRRLGGYEEPAVTGEAWKMEEEEQIIQNRTRAWRDSKDNEVVAEENILIVS